MKNYKWYISLVFCIISTSLLSQIEPPGGISNNMILWLSPDSGVYQSPGNPANIGDIVSEWHDISGGGFTFTTTQGPTMVNYKGKKMTKLKAMKTPFKHLSSRYLIFK